MKAYIGHLRGVVGHVAAASVADYAVEGVGAAAVIDRRQPRQHDGRLVLEGHRDVLGLAGGTCGGWGRGDITFQVITLET